jgi:L-iditol 2-dehydrogenase
MKFARGSGADAAVRADEPKLIDRVIAANDGRRIDRVLVCAASKTAMQQALQLVELGGSVLFFAPLLPDDTLDYPAHDLWKKGVTIVQSYAGPPADMQTALRLIEAGRVDVAPMITHRIPLERTEEGFRLMTESGDSLKVIVQP